MSEIAGCKERTIKKWCVEKHRLMNWDRAKQKCFNKEQIDLIIGSLLGDGHIDKRPEYPLFIVSHAENQKDYLYYKYEILKELCEMTPTKYDGGEKLFTTNNETYVCQDYYRFNTRTYWEFDKYRKLSEIDVVEKLNEYSFSIWMLDDGYCDKKGYWQLCSAEMTKEENLLVISILKQKFGVQGHLKKDVRYIHFNTIGSHIITNIILQNIPNDLDIIKYKIIDKRAYARLESSNVYQSTYA